MHTHEIVDLFAGPGGLDVAAAWLDIPVVGIELDENACATREAAKLRTKQGDVRDSKPGDFPNANVLAAGPPCQTYTVAGSGTGRQDLNNVLSSAKRMANGEDVTAELKRLSDPRTALVLEPLRWILEAIKDERPYEAIILEQVPAVLQIWAVMDEILTGLGYAVAHGVLRTEQYGVPQTRRRAVLIARRKDKVESDMALPSATHHPYRKGMPRPEKSGGIEPWVTMGEVLKRPEPFTVVSNYGTGGNPRARGERKSTEPSATVTGKISRNRVLTDGIDSRFTHSESGLLQTFPPDYPWRGKDVAQQIGNAIPPLLAAHVIVAALGMEPDFLKNLRADRLPLWSETMSIDL
ncbi:DNA cytosine methyltransferase [Streptosporangium sandarakinum]